MLCFFRAPSPAALSASWSRSASASARVYVSAHRPLASPASVQASCWSPAAQHQASLGATSEVAPTSQRTVLATAVAPGSSKEAGMADKAPEGKSSAGGQSQPSSGSTYGSVSLNPSELEDAVQDAIVWANQHGLVVALGQSEAPERAVIHAPLSALPVPFPRARFMQAKAVQTLFNSLVDAVARDEQYLEATLSAAARYDDFTGRLLQLLKETRAERQSRPEIALGIHRSDYMLDAPSGGFLQVELNTIASSFGCLSALMTRLHRYLIPRLPPSAQIDPSSLPDNPAIDSIPDAIAAAAKAHGVQGGVVVMVVQPGERNAYDQQWIQHQLWDRHRLRTLRRTLKEIQEQGQLDSQGTLSVTSSLGRVPVAVVYFRAGYTPADYPSEAEWEARRLVERSNAARCPTVAYQLAGAKKVQQDLARPGVLERFLASRSDANNLRSFFAGLWSLDDLKDPETQAIVQQALSDPDGFVLKPQREGGGNNLYGDELVARLKQGDEGLSAFILMQKIRPPPQTSILVRAGQWAEADTLSELGVYGVYLRRGSDVLLNAEAGHLVRTKKANSNEGGVAAGFAVLDSPRLV